MRRIPALAFAIAIVAASSFAAVAQGWGPRNGPGRGMGPCAQRQNSTECWRTKNPEKHAACWSKANDSCLRGAARRNFMTECMIK